MFRAPRLEEAHRLLREQLPYRLCRIPPLVNKDNRHWIRLVMMPLPMLGVYLKWEPGLKKSTSEYEKQYRFRLIFFILELLKRTFPSFRYFEKDDESENPPLEYILAAGSPSGGPPLKTIRLKTKIHWIDASMPGIEKQVSQVQPYFSIYPGALPSTDLNLSGLRKKHAGSQLKETVEGDTK